MNRTVEISNNERQYVLQGLANGIRTDGRSLDTSRMPEVWIEPNEYGYVEVKWGKTYVSCRVSSEVVAPFEDRPFEGLFVINSEISSQASAMFDNSKSGVDEVLITRMIEKAVRRSNALDLESLCIVAGKKVWSITVDVNFLNYDGNFIDVTCFAVMIALQHYKKPDVLVEAGGDKIIVHLVDERQPVPLSILHVPICLTYLFYNLGDIESNIKGEGTESQEVSVLDASLTEELVRDGFLVITLNKNREIIQISKNGGLPIDALNLMRLSKELMEWVDKLTEVMKTTLVADEKERYDRLHLKLLEVGANR
ncbi:uncharacterized protein KQ657_000843 [Scheffersomyces spartinae]|uniref:Uncharacterized protein n=1 Tax=Scheffersomyces spartinae TaxID=45513 RepID=A0A9P8AI67_9ASCO|nr:uncharacterized protein KQ657_000843 [Scheffersomyces spartinae]KAG7193425.1 hypothetical protein KQ657_000843 [Scheffersomyces spartinae]